MSKNAPPPQPPLPESIVVGCNTWNCKSKISNANWETKVNEPITVNQGDTINVKASFIDTRGSASSDVVIPRDTEISLEYYFYWVHNFNACDVSGLTSGTPTPPDASNNLTQQVMVGRDIINLCDDSSSGAYLPSYTTNIAGTGINDADGLPYIVYQTTTTFPVPPVVGAVEDARFIVPGGAYLVTTVGLTINWEYANVQGANYNQMPAGWDFLTDWFEAGNNNPWYNVPSGQFIPAALAAPLPYITYVISVVGDTDWIAIDPGLASNQVSALEMVNGGRYIIASVNPTWDFTYWGAALNTVGDVFTATIPPALPVTFPFTITTADFLANVSTWFVANGGPIFGADPDDTFNVVVDVNAGNNMVLIDVSGSGGWLIPAAGSVFANGGWEIPNSFFGFSDAGTPLANPVQKAAVITNIVPRISGLSVANLTVGKTYTVLAVGDLDGSVPQFTWNMVGAFPGYNSTTMSDGTTYQIIAPYEGVNFPAIPGLGQVSFYFNQQGGEIQPPPGPQQLIKFSGPGEVFVATGSYTGTGTIATVEQYTTESAVITGTGYIPPMVELSVIEPGTIVHAINPDPAPTTSTGLADVAELQYDSTIPLEYDGYVAAYTPPSTRTDIRPVKKKWKMMLKAGSYDPNYLSEKITRSMSRQKTKRVNQVQGGPFGTQSTLTVPTDNIWNIGKDASANEWASPLGPGQNTFYDSKNPNVYGYPSEIDYNISPDQDDMPFIFVPAMNGSKLYNNNNPPDLIYAEIPHPGGNGLNNLTSPNYYINLVPLISDVRSVSPTIPATVQTDGYYSILPFYSQNGTTDTNGVVTGNSGIFPIAFGATQTSLIYNNENNGLFSFNYLHSPMLAFLSTTSNDLTEVTAHMYTTAQKTTTMSATNFFTTLVDKNSGILLHKMEPASFWNQLGFDIPALTVDLDNPDKIGFQMTLNEFNAKTTGGFCGASNIFNQNFHAVGSAMQPSVPDTEVLFLTAIPAAEQNSVIDALEPNLTVGKIYTIYNIGRFGDFYGTYPRVNWLEVGGLNPASSGQTFTAISTGFTALPDGFDWDTLPTVLEAGIAVATTTQLQNNYFAVESTNSLDAVRIPTVKDQTGHYLIEITAYPSIYLDDYAKREIKSIVSTYYVSQGAFVSGVFPDSYSYYHVGAPMTISNLKIRLLEPFTMEEIVNIGPNSSVYLQISKMLSDQAIAQVEN